MLIAGARVLLPGGFEYVDVRTSGDRIAEIGTGLASTPGERVENAAGKLLSAGLVDLHSHTFTHGFHMAVDADALSSVTGVTTFVDAGSAGAVGFPSFYEHVMKRSASRMYAYLNISILGQTISALQEQGFNENDSHSLVHLPLAEEMIDRYSDVIRGIKVRAYTNMPDLYPLEQASKLSRNTGLPIMTHIGSAPPAIEDVLPFLGRGDLVTHLYHGGTDTLLDDEGRVRPVFQEARKRGVEFDLGMDRFHCDLSIMRRAFDQGFYPDYISSDLTLTNIDSITFDLPTCISKCVASGMPLDTAIEKSTIRVAEKLGISDKVGSIEVGKIADLALFEWAPSEEPFVDFFGNGISDADRLVNTLTIRAGTPLVRNYTQPGLWRNSQRAVPWANYV